MDEQNLNQAPLPDNMRTKKKVWAIVIPVVIIIALIGAWFVWANYLSPDAQRQRQLQENYQTVTP